MPIFKKITKAIVHGFVKKWGFEVGNEIESFSARVCPKNFRATARLFIPYLYVQFSVNIDVGVVSTRLEFSGKLSKLQLSFLTYN